MGADLFCARWLAMNHCAAHACLPCLCVRARTRTRTLPPPRDLLHTARTFRWLHLQDNGGSACACLALSCRRAGSGLLAAPGLVQHPQVLRCACPLALRTSLCACLPAPSPRPRTAHKPACSRHLRISSAAPLMPRLSFSSSRTRYVRFTLAEFCFGLEHPLCFV